MIVLLGMRGLLGTHLCKQFPDVIGISSLECDITREDDIRRVLDTYKPDAVINAAGETRNTALMYDVNVTGAKNVSTITGEYGIRLVHLSTNCVFNGDQGFYSELDEPDIASLDHYGYTKLLGEMPFNPNQISIRTSFVGWPDFKGNSLLSWFMQQETPVPGYSRAFWNGLTAWELSKWLVKLCDMGSTGIFHFGMSEYISKYTLLLYVNHVYQLNKEIFPDPLTRENKTLVTERCNFAFPPFREQLEEMKKAWKT